MYRPIIAPRTTAALVAGAERVTVKLVNGARNMGLLCVVRGTVQVSVAAATTLRNRGSGLALIDRIYLNENGKDVSTTKGNVLRVASEMIARSALSATRAAVGVATYQLEEAFYLQFAEPEALDPLETAYMEADARQDFSLQFTMAPNFAARLFTVGPATVTVTNVTVTVIQDYETPTETGHSKPLFIPIITEQIAQINGDVSADPIYLRTTNNLRKIIISQEDSVLGEVGDILRTFAIKGDYKDIIGPTQIDVDDMLLRSEFEFGGNVITSNRAHIGMNFQRYGQLSETLSPMQDVSLRLQISALPSVLGVAAGGTSSLRITKFELYRAPGVTAPVVPFKY
jgi:hypothetical protein